MATKNVINVFGDCLWDLRRFVYELATSAKRDSAFTFITDDKEFPDNPQRDTFKIRYCEKIDSADYKKYVTDAMNNGVIPWLVYLYYPQNEQIYHCIRDLVDRKGTHIQQSDLTEVFEYRDKKCTNNRADEILEPYYRTKDQFLTSSVSEISDKISEELKIHFDFDYSNLLVIPAHLLAAPQWLYCAQVFLGLL